MTATAKGTVQAVIFDVDGTLVDSVDLHTHAWVETLRHFGYAVEFAEVRSQIGKGGDQLVPVFVPEDDRERLQPEIERYRHALFLRDHIAQVKPFPAVPDLFRRLKETGRKVALASSGKPDEIKRYKAILGIEGLPDVETASSDAEQSKPHPDIFQAALDKLGVGPAEAVVVGDTPWDALAATRAGIAAIGMLCGGFPEGALRDAGCREIYRDPQDLLRRLDESVIGG
ncbi:HAD family hydrolase [Azospirillum thermophilum]|uniref:HAD family hydrolase n=1 Tax=Azospirillum thermophilum TaxID=2202148 RepID=A0A2S2CXC5_9PROT|nr:HAD family hydrolase [Azospirillum thermophilum]AWK89065.1 HAD family hydrolase [Azospirillum thermophilum]